MTTIPPDTTARQIDAPVNLSGQRPRSAVPSGPKGSAFFGNLFQFKKDPIEFLSGLARDYGDIAQFRLGRQRAVQLNHPDYIRDVLVTHSRKFCKTRGLDRAALVIGKGLLTSEGDFHRRQRRLAQPAFHPQRICGYGSMMTQYASRLAHGWQDGEQVDVFSEMLRLTLAIVGQTLFGTDIESESEDIGKAMTTVFEYFNRLMLPFGGIFAKLPLPSRRRFEQARELLDRTVNRMVLDRRSAGDDRGDLLSMLLLARDEGEAGVGMSDTQVRDEVMTMFLAGHETTATALTWTWYLLATNPVAEAELHRELDRVLAGRVPTTSDLPNLKYTRMVLAESMRLYPPVWTLTRRAMEDYDVDGYLIPAGTIVGMSQYVMHRDRRFYPEPDQFLPSRWTPEQAAQRPKYAYFPFGGGPRLCIGEQFAWMEASLILATLCQTWRARVPSNYCPQLRPLITLRPQGGLPVRLQRRSAEPANRGPNAP